MSNLKIIRSGSVDSVPHLSELLHVLLKMFQVQVAVFIQVA